MIHRFFIVIIFLIGYSLSSAQSRRADSLTTLIVEEKDPYRKFDLLRAKLELINIEFGSNVDSASCIQLLQIAQDLKNDSLLAISYNWIGAFFSFTNGDNVTALEYFFKGVPLAERANDKRRLSSLYFDIAVIYYELQDYTSAFENTVKGGENLPDKSSPNYDFMVGQYERNMAAYYMSIPQPDSVLKYARLHAATAERYKGFNFQFSALLLQGAACALSQQDSLASMYFEKASEMGRFIKIYSLSGLFYKYYLRFLIDKGKLNEARQVAKQYLAQSEADGIPLAGLRAAGFLREVYDSLHNVDSAYYYSRLEADINARIFSQENVNKIKGLAFQEELRGIEEVAAKAASRNRIRQYAFLFGIGVLLLIAFFLYRNNRQRKKANVLLLQQKVQVENQKEKIESTLSELKLTQAQLIQSEKMASLGELTAGIAHEIQNPLNFVNNFSEVSVELTEETEGRRQEAGENNPAVTDLLQDIKKNLSKINHHGKRAEAIVKGMLQHSQVRSGTKELTDINALVDEYLRLALQSYKAKDNSFDVIVNTNFDESAGKINIVPQDIGRVLLNLLNNAFYACASVNRRDAMHGVSTINNVVSVATKRTADKIEITVKDNGSGIPLNIIDKIFQPFFTTKPTGQGTGLGLSLAYDIITKGHGGELKANSKDASPSARLNHSDGDDAAGQGEGSEFTIILPTT
ncbi:sensor histidine kinase [Pollutibacter soli]|uniref:sensor histidine kinase n=1 Tax=Pollutibacter soli TaxID=3034157 RepID=UPI00301345C7